MYIIIAKKEPAGMSRGFQRVNNHVVVTAPDEESLEKTLNDLANEGDRGESHEIVQVLWKGGA